ncbi:MAG: hypothetical protein RIQ96_1448 [Pseudomonadota bacterium]
MPRAAAVFVPGHALALLEGASALFEALCAAIDAARDEVRLETYILDVQGATVPLLESLERAARRGVRVRVAVDGVGTPALPAPWAQRLADAGVELRVFAPLGTLGLLIPSRWRRLHRKLAVVDGEVGFCGGINLLDDWHDPNHGPLSAPRLDFAVRLHGPLASAMHIAMQQLWQRMEVGRRLRQRDIAEAFDLVRAAAQARRALRGAWRLPALAGTTLPREAVRVAGPGTLAALVLRDNLRHRFDIERAYRKAIGEAREEVLVANAYFLPGRKLRASLMHAARRGVRVQLLLQGRYEYFMQYYATRSVYGELLAAGVQIHEYEPSFLHAKVAVIDGRWATVGSSNLDPLSLLLAREANVLVDDAGFAGALRRRLLHALANESRRIDPQQLAQRSWGERVHERIALALMRTALFLTGMRY